MDLVTASLQLLIREEGKVVRRNRQQRMEEAEMSDGLKKKFLNFGSPQHACSAMDVDC